MSETDDADLVDSTNHIIAPVQDHESCIARMESEQKQLKEHLKRLTEQMVIGIKTESTFFDMFDGLMHHFYRGTLKRFKKGCLHCSIKINSILIQLRTRKRQKKLSMNLEKRQSPNEKSCYWTIITAFFN